jgi:hypothetical protein
MWGVNCLRTNPHSSEVNPNRRKGSVKRCPQLGISFV